MIKPCQYDYQHKMKEAMIMVKNRINMCEGPVLKQMIIFSLPILFTGFLQQLFNAADVMLAGRLGTSGSDAVAAVGTATPLTALLINFFIGCSTGSAVTVSHALGSKDTKQIKETVHTAMLLSFIIGLLLTAIGLAFSRTLLEIISTPDSIIGKSTAYLQTYFTSMVPYMIYYFGAAILRANGETQKPFYFLLISGPVKLILTVVFVSVLRMDVSGLALATTCSQFVAAALVVIELLKGNDNFKLSFKDLKLSKGALNKILRLGIPSGIQSSTYSISNVIIQSSVNSLSNISGFITGNAAAASLFAFGDIMTGVFYQISLNFTGQNVGAKKYDRVKRIYLTNSLLSVVAIAVFSAFMCVFAKQLLGIYIDDSSEAIKWGVVRILFVFIPLIFQGLMDVTAGSLRGMGISISNTIVSIICICGFRITWCLTIFNIPEFHNPYILFSSYPLSWIINYIFLLIIFIITYKRKVRKYYNQN